MLETTIGKPDRSSLTEGLTLLPPTAPEPMRRACEAARVRAETEVAKIPPSGTGLGGEASGRPGEQEVSLLGQCFSAGAGAWVLEIEALPPRSGGHYRLWATLVTAEGKAIRSATPVPANGAAPSGQTVGLSQVGPLLDWDEDGSPDLLLSIRGMDFTEPIGTDVWRGVAYARHGGRVDALAVPAFTSRPRLDPDGDGRADFPLQKHGWSTRCTGPSTSTQDSLFSYDLPMLAHNTGKGVFRVDDEVARAWARGHGCPAWSPGAPLLDDDTEVSLRRILCARLMGVSSSVLAARVRSEHAQLSKGMRYRLHDRCAPLAHLLRAAAWRPDEVLTASE